MVYNSASQEMDIELNNGIKMPSLGLGTYQIRGSESILTAVKTALDVGYRLIDTASVYNNEYDIGCALNCHLPLLGLKRSDIFITSKLAPKDQGHDKCAEAFSKSLQHLDTDFLDLYLIHWPGVQSLKPNDPLNKEKRKDSWLQMEKLYKAGKVKAIGVSNYTIDHLRDMFTYCSVKPAINQVECHPHLVQSELLSFCRQEGIHVQAYSSLGTSSHKVLPSDPSVQKVADKYSKTTAQILLKWALQQNLSVIPKSCNPVHIKCNFDLWNFHLEDEDITLLNKLNRNMHYAWDPTPVI